MSKITKSARGQQCLIRLPGCNRDPATVVFCHTNGAGMGLKHSDLEGAYGCSHCHDVVDGRKKLPGWNHTQVTLAHHEGAVRTRAILLEDGLITIGD